MNYTSQANIHKFTVSLVIILLSSILISTTITLKISANTTSSSQQAIDCIAQELADVSNSIRYDPQTGLATNLDVNALVSKYGSNNQNQLQHINEIMKYEYKRNLQFNQGKLNSIQTRSFWSCMKNQLLDMIGYQTFQALLRGGIQGLIQRKAWKAAAKLLIRYLGDGIGVGFIAAQLTWYAIRCA
ncbi:membrane protein [Lactiplantibacillus plantarum]|nr:hypothetical protein [Lactiplantibacillus plantarum]VDH11277.1 membrane protein [Lactiplantibacillus plantarum]